MYNMQTVVGKKRYSEAKKEIDASTRQPRSAWQMPDFARMRD